MNYQTYFTLSLIMMFMFASCKHKNTTHTKSMKAQTELAEDSVTYTSDGLNMKGFVVYNEKLTGKRPAVLVVHEWWGLTDYPKKRARQLADLGYIAMAIDMFGNGQTASTPDQAKALTASVYKDPQTAHKRFEAAMTKFKTYPQVDTNNIAAIGYCFGGSQVITMAKLGSNLKGIVSFHGGLNVAAPAKKELLHAKMLICNGEADKSVKPENVQAFKKEMDSIGANYTIKNYPDATHAFTNPDATAIGEKYNMPIRYNAEADKQSWEDMKSFFNDLFK